MATHAVRLALSALCLALPTFAAAGEDEPIQLPPVEVHASYPLVPPQYRRTPIPAYPATAREQGVEGLVLLEVHVLADGRVRQVRLKSSSGSSALDDAAVKAVKEWTFMPARRGSRFVDSWVEIPFKFNLTSK